jgi:hypothetical protein
MARKTVTTQKRYKTVEAKNDDGGASIVKPGELVDVVEMTPLTLADRRIYNELLGNAWDEIAEPKTHRIAKAALRGSHNVNDRVGESIERLMAGIFRIRIERNGETFIRRIQLLGTTDEADRQDGMLYYSFPEELRKIIVESTVFARIQRDVMYSLSSKYALALYEMIQKRGNLKHQWAEEFTVERFRDLLGVEQGKLASFKALNQWAIRPAVDDINAVGEFGCKVEPIMEGRKVAKVRLSWWRKNAEEFKAAFNERRGSKVGRRARASGTIEQVFPVVALPPAETDGQHPENRLSFRQPIGAEDQRKILLPAGWRIDGGPDRWKGGIMTPEVLELYRQWGGGNSGK